MKTETDSGSEKETPGPGEGHDTRRKPGNVVFDHLVVSLWDKDKWVRIAAADALAGLADIRAYRYIVNLLADTDPDVRFAITESLGKLGDTRAIGPLEAACHDCNFYVRQGAQEALQKLGTVSPRSGWKTGNGSEFPVKHVQENPNIP